MARGGAVLGQVLAGGALALAAACAPQRLWLARAAAVYAAAAAPAQTAAPTPTQTPTPTAAVLSAPVSAAALTPTPTPTPAPTETPTPANADAAPELDNPGAIEAKHYAQGSGAGYAALAAGSIRNLTEHPDSDLQAAASGAALPFEIELNSAEPQVLILHTHATESYQTWQALVYDPDWTGRTDNTALNMCAVGAEMAAVLNAAGVNTLHDTALHDAAGYTDSYERSAEAVRAALAQYPSIKVVLDVHRDAIENEDGTRIKPLCQVDGEDAAQVMIIAGCDNGTTAPLPNWRLNLRFAAAWESEMETLYPGLTRPVLCAYRYYNQDLSSGSLLVEIGSHANTLTEARRAARAAARALAALFGADVPE